MLQARILTAAVLIPIVLLALLLPSWPFDVIVAVVIALAAWEFAVLIGLQKGVAIPVESSTSPPPLMTRIKQLPTLLQQQPYCLAYSVGLVLLYVAGCSYPMSTLFIASLWWILATVVIISFPTGHLQWQSFAWLRALTGILILVPMGVGLIVLHNLPARWPWVLWLLLIVWSADTGAYFAGRYLGKTPLLPAVSPKKTLEGVVGGLVTVTVINVLYTLIVNIPFLNYPFLWLMTLLAFFFSIVGDLSISVIKRWLHVKDTGNLLPGHGGILDRIDSLAAATPIFAFGIALIRLLG